jgi:hypothetical protein
LQFYDYLKFSFENRFEKFSLNDFLELQAFSNRFHIYMISSLRHAKITFDIWLNDGKKESGSRKHSGWQNYNLWAPMFLQCRNFSPLPCM